MEKKSGADGLGKKVTSWTKKHNQSKDLKVVGSDSTNMMTGHKGGAIHYVEEGIGHKCLWSICQLHTNELPLRHIIAKIDLQQENIHFLVY